MDVISQFITSMEEIIVSLGTGATFLFQTYEFFPGTAWAFSSAPIFIISFGGLTTFLAVAMIKWIGI